MTVTSRNGVPDAIRRTFDDLHAALPGISVKEFPATPGKIGLRAGARVVFTYNSYRKGWLDTQARLGPWLDWFDFKRTHNKPKQYWAAKLAPEQVEAIYRANRTAIVAALSEWLEAAGP